MAALDARRSVLVDEARQQQWARERLEQAIKDGELSGSLGRLSAHLHPDDSMRVPVLAALGEAAHGFVFRDAPAVDAALAWLASAPCAGRVNLIPQAMNGEPPAALSASDPGSLGNAADLARPDEAVRAAVAHLLGRTLIVETREHARRLAAELPAGSRLVTRLGEVFSSSGEVLVGVPEEDRPAEGLEQLEAELEQAQAARAEWAERAEALRAELDTARGRLAEAVQAAEAAAGVDRLARLRVEQVTFELRSTEAQLESLLAAVLRLTQDVERADHERDLTEQRGQALEAEEREAQAEVDALALRLSGGEGAAMLLQLEANVQLARSAAGESAARAADAESRLSMLQADLEQRRLRAEVRASAESAARRDHTEADAGLQLIEASLAETQAQAEALEAQLSRLEAERTEHEAAEARSRFDLQEAERAHSQAQIELARRQQELVSLQQRIEDDFGLVAFEYDEGVTGAEPLPLNGWVEHLPHVEAVAPELETQVGRLRLQLRRMGAVNTEARREYEEVRQRADFLTAQVDDLRKAEAQIQEVIAELDLLMEREFRKTFDAVAIAFRQVFTRLFGGGTARLILTDSDDLTNTGIDIEARLPGRREHGLAMLSGGERSLTACALVFSLLKVSPTPFCVLDEVDAMLDEANVGRFCEMLRELSQQTQFVIITHNRQTVQTAEVVYGVTMGSDSASRVLSLRLDEAEKLASG
ncbi:MAG: hypothetical protein V1750_06620 [Acidobacteriota bacterium]